MGTVNFLKLTTVQRTAGVGTDGSYVWDSDLERLYRMDGVTTGGVVIGDGGSGGGSAGDPLVWYTTNYNTAIGAGQRASVTVTVTGAVAGTDVISHVRFPNNAETELTGWGWVTANDTAVIWVHNTSTSPITVVDVQAAYTSTQNQTATEDVVATVAGLASSTATYVRALGYYSTSDGGEGLFESRESGAAVNGGYVFAHGSGGNWRYHRLGVQERAVHVRHFGARSDGVSANATATTAAIQAAIDYLSGLGQSSYSGTNSLIFEPGSWWYCINDELTVPSWIGQLQVICFEGRATIRQYNADTLGAPIFKFTIDGTTPGSEDKHRHMTFSNMNLSYATAQAATKTRSICVAWTNWPEALTTPTIGAIYGCKFINCQFNNFYRGVAPIPAGQTDAVTASAFAQSFVFWGCYAGFGSGAFYYTNTTSSGSPQLTIIDCMFQCQNLTEDFISCQGNLGFTLRNCEFLKGEGQRIAYLGDCHWADISGLMIEDWDMPSGGELFQINSGNGSAQIGGGYHINSVIGGDTVIFRTFNAKLLILGPWRVRDITHNSGGKHAIGAVQNGGTGAVGWDGVYSTDVGSGTTKFITLDTASLNPAVLKSAMISPLTTG